MFFITEAFEKPQELITAEEQIQTLLDGMRKTVGIKYFNKNNKIIDILDECLSKLFDADVSIFVVGTGYYNAFCLPLSNSLKTSFDPYKVKMNKYGCPVFDKKDKVSLGVYVDAQLFDGTLTSEEIIAIILHEMGHHFQQYKNRTLAVVPFYQLIMAAIDAKRSGAKNINDITSMIVLAFMNISPSAYNKVAKVLFKPNPTSLYITAMYGYILKIFNIFRNFTTPSFINLSYLFTLPRLLQGVIGQAQEYEADDFVRFYGYTPALASALDKITLENNLPKEVRGIPVVNCVFAMDAFVKNSVMSLLLFDHPDNNSRLVALEKSTIKALKDTSISDTDKKNLKAQLEDLKKVHDLISSHEGENLAEDIFRYSNTISEKFSLSKLIQPIFPMIKKFFGGIGFKSLF